MTDFAEISWQLTARRIEDLKTEKSALESASDVLQQLAAREQEMAGRLGRLEDQADKLQRRIGANEEAAKEIAAAVEECAAVLAEQPVTDDAGVLAAVAALAAAALGDKPLTYKNTAAVESTVRAGLTDIIDALVKRIARTAETTVRLMADFRNKYPTETTEIDAALEAAGDYNRLLEQLASNDLPPLRSPFQGLAEPEHHPRGGGLQRLPGQPPAGHREPDRRNQPLPGRD
ncbi:hypothetical protein ACOM2C_17175 [Pseudarthrobacter sp. So.54]